MKIITYKNNEVLFKEDDDGEIYGKLSIGKVDFEFSFQKHENINWSEIEFKINYFLENHKSILKLSNQVIINFYKNNNWGSPKNKYNFEIIELPVTGSNLDVLIVLPYLDEDPYSDWSIHFVDKKGPKVRTVLRNDKTIV